MEEMLMDKMREEFEAWVPRTFVLDTALWKARASISERQGGGRDAAGLLETFVKLTDYLGIDCEEARKARGKPSDVFIDAIERRIAARGLVNGN
jgi:hypothetical protein